jgi:hypothetical protein
MYTKKLKQKFLRLISVICIDFEIAEVKSNTYHISLLDQMLMLK